MRNYESVQKWFSAKKYEPTTEVTYTEYMKMFCSLLNETPDQIAYVTSEQALGLQQVLERMMRNTLHLKNHSIIMRISALHSFWRANGVNLTKQIMIYEGSPLLMREKSKRS